MEKAFNYLLNKYGYVLKNKNKKLNIFENKIKSKQCVKHCIRLKSIELARSESKKPSIFHLLLNYKLNLL